MTTQSAVQPNRSQVVDQAIRDFFFQSTVPVKLRHSSAKFLHDFPRLYFSEAVNYTLDYGITADVQSIFDELEAQI